MKISVVISTLLVVYGLLLGQGQSKGEEAWPGFRGWGDGHSRTQRLPLSWQPRGRAEGNWTIRLPGYGQSSPVVWGDRIFVTAVSGAEKEHLHLLAVDIADGKVLWQKDFAASQRIQESDTVSRGAPTPVVDADRVYAVFESGDIVALAHTGELVWERSFVKEYGELQGAHGYSSSPVLVDDLMIIQVSHAGPSYIFAIDRETGQNRWKVDHPSQTGWSSPTVYRHGDQQGVIVSTSGSVRALNTKSGTELWYVHGVKGNTVSSPVVAGELVLIGVGGDRGGNRSAGGTVPTEGNTPNETSIGKDSSQPETAVPEPSPQAGCLAIRLGGSGNVTTTHVAWRAPRVTVGYASPLVLDDCVYFINRIGGIQCVDLNSGELHWQHRLPGTVWSSPVAHQGNLICFTKDGTVIALKSGPTLIEEGESTLSATDVVYGVAAVNNSWIVRTGRSLQRINSGASEELAP